MTKLVVSLETNPFHSIDAMVRSYIHKIREQALASNLIKKNELSCPDIEYVSNHQFTIRNSLQNRNDSDIRKILIVITSFCIFFGTINHSFIDILIGVRCFIPNNYLIWEATRPISDCQFCAGVQHPLILPNITRHEFWVRFHHNIDKMIFSLLKIYYRYS